MGVNEVISKSSILSSRLPFKASRTALGLILATLFLAVMLTVSTLQNINRSQSNMERFLLQNGETIIGAIEASMRTSLRHHMGEGDALHTLLVESSRANDIVFIIVMDAKGRVLSQTDNAPDIRRIEIERIQPLDPDTSVTSVDEETGIFTITKRLNLQTHLNGMLMMDNQLHPVSGNKQNLSGATISIGLFTEDFDNARRQDVQHAVFMGAILFLVGSAGLYVLFLYQGIRVAKSTLANMKIYTENVIESIPVGLVTLDREDKIASCNRKMEDIFGRSLESIQGRTLNEAFPDCQVNPAEICASILDYSADCETVEGRNIPVKIGGSSLVNNEGETIGTVLVVRDMSMIREMEQQLERSRRMAALGKMAAGIAHEIRNPLGTLRGFAHYFGNQPGVGDEGKKYAKLMESEVDRLNRNISGLLQFARPREPNIVGVNLDDLISKTVALMEGDFTEKTLNFHYQCNTDITLDSDPDMLLQVLMNLLKNSIFALSAGGEVSLKTTEEQHQVRIAVSDNGIGMTEQEREKMFDPFFTTRNTGTGLGLAVSHQIIEQLNGSFDVQTAQGKGTSVTIILPKKRGKK
jgi:two-component system sensor histidine kinase HydH